MSASFLTRTFAAGLVALLLPVVAWAQNGPIEPGRVDIQNALNLARRAGTMGPATEQNAAATALSFAKNDAEDAFNVQAMLDVADGYRQIGNLDMMDNCLDKAYDLALRWAFYRGTTGENRDGQNVRYGHRMLSVVGTTKLPVRPGLNGQKARDNAKRDADILAQDLSKGLPQIFKGSWRTGRNTDVEIEQVGNRLRGSIGTLEFKVEITGINGDVVTATGPYTDRGTSGTMDFTLNLTRSNQINVVMHTPGGNNNSGFMKRP